MLWSHSFISFIWSIAGQIILYTDNVVIGIFLEVKLVAFYAIGGSLVLYSGQVVTALSTTFLPLASRLNASGNSERLKTLLLRGCQASLAIMFPISLTLLFRGKTFINLWMGPQYGPIAGTGATDSAHFPVFQCLGEHAVIADDGLQVNTNSARDSGEYLCRPGSICFSVSSW